MIWKNDLDLYTFYLIAINSLMISCWRRPGTKRGRGGFVKITSGKAQYEASKKLLRRVIKAIFLRATGIFVFQTVINVSAHKNDEVCFSLISLVN